MKNKWYQQWWFYLLLGLLLAFLLNNFTTQKVYDFGSCTYNQNDCGLDAWNGVCTSNITSKCCTPIDYCGGNSDTEEGCYAGYCGNGQYCGAEYNIALADYTCGCVDIPEIQN